MNVRVFARSSPFPDIPIWVPAVGKTTLGKSLERGSVAALFAGKKERDDENISERTRGVAVRPISIPGHKDADFSLWDYAGQEQVR
jgi:GTPase SAR1 family protein